MALYSSNLLLVKSHISLYSSSNPTIYFKRRTSSVPQQPWLPPETRVRVGPISLSIRSDDRKEDIVIIGAGIAVLATAVSLQRLGIRTLVLEQAESLRTGGTSLTLSKNGWKALDAIGVRNDLRTQFLEIQGMVVKSEDGRELRSFRFKDEDESQEVRAVERRVLLETLASNLPPDAISFSSKLANVERSENGETMLELEDGIHISAKILIACDGIRSPWPSGWDFQSLTM